jgi:DNA-binding transcriptional regulator YhcF (GntR family)
MSLTDEAYAVLRRRIVRCELAPGERVTERALSADLDLGLTPIREALARLDQERLVITIPRRGYLVTPLTARNIVQTSQVWAVLAPTIAELGVLRATAEQAAAVCADLGPDWPGVPRPGDEGLLASERRSRGWRLLAHAGGNEVLADLHLRIDGLVMRLSTLLFDRPLRSPRVPQPDWPELFRRRDREHTATDVRRYSAAVVAEVERVLAERGTVSAAVVHLPETGQPSGRWSAGHLGPDDPGHPPQTLTARHPR